MGGGLDSVSALEAVAHRISNSAERSESESMKQIRIINQLMQKKFATTNYSPDDRCCSLDASDSLKDFSVGGGGCPGGETHRGPIPAGSTPNEYKQGRQIGPNMMSVAEDFNQVNLLKLPCEEKYYQSNNTSLAGVKDSISTCQNVRQ